MPAVFATLAFIFAYSAATTVAVENINDDDYYYKSGSMVAAQTFASLSIIMALPLYIAIMLMCCCRFKSRTFLWVVMILSFVMAAFLLLLLVCDT